MHVRDHGTNVPRTVGFPVRGELDRFEVGFDGLVEEERVALVEGVDFTARGNTDVGVREDELSDSLRGEVREREGARVRKEREGGREGRRGEEGTNIVESVTVDSLSHTDDHVGGGSVHAVPSRDHLFPGSENIGNRSY